MYNNKNKSNILLSGVGCMVTLLYVISFICKHSVQDSSGIFWDNDSLAGLLAVELKADLVLLSDVEGLYSGPPSDPNSKLFNVYVKERHHREITFGAKSRLGRGGMRL